MLTTRVKTILAALLALAGVFFMVYSLHLFVTFDNPAFQASAFQKRLSRELPALESQIDRPQAKIPGDMVIYQYVNGKLEHWRNQFPIHNDLYTYSPDNWFFGYSDRTQISPLAFVGDEFKLQSFSGQYYLVKKTERRDGTYILGYRLRQDCQIMPAGYFGGYPVSYCGKVLFKMYFDQHDRTMFPKQNYLWAAYCCLIAALLFFLLAGPDIRRMLYSMVAILVLSSAMYAVGSFFPEADTFSALHYSGNAVFYSIGVVPLLNIFVFGMLSCLAITRRELALRFPVLDLTGKRGVCLCLIVLILGYVYISLKNLILNTDMVLAFINLSEMTVPGFLIAMSYLLTMTMIALLIQMGFRVMKFWEPVGLSLILGVALVGMAAYFSFQKESDNLKVASAALASNRDVNAEALLLKKERQIQKDTVLVNAALAAEEEFAARYITETYLNELSSKYEITVFVAREEGSTFLRDLRRNMVRIAPSSRFHHVQNSQTSRYVAMFPYYQGPFIRNLVVILDNKFQESSFRQTDLHPKYSYARYRDGKLFSFRGQFAYPTIISEGLSDNARYKHFVFDFGDRDQIVVSRRRIGPGSYISSVIFCALLYFVLLLAFGIGQKISFFQNRAFFERNILMITEILVLVTILTIVTVSVMFIYGNNRKVLQTLIAERVSTLQSAVQGNMGHIYQPRDLYSVETSRALNFVQKCTESVLMIYSVDGQLVAATTQPAENGIPSFRMPEEAKINVIDNHLRYYISRNRNARGTQYEMYAPIFSRSGEIVAVLRSPYIGIETFEMENDAVMHVITLLSILFIILFVARYLSEKFYRTVFGSLTLMSGKMLNANLDNLEHIEYDRKDEIRGIVDSYNLMVDRLAQNTLQLAEAERNQAWTGMARQVAHEIKNPLTPMKLQIQRVMRLKEKGDPSWQEKLEEAAAVMLEHINVLTETADEFSSFAKLYSETPVSIDLDALLRQELSMFDCREDITFEYRGMPGALISGPKPQLTRVFVNLLNNSVQALDNVPEQSARTISVCIRRPAFDSCYEIVFQDNGPGVSSENEAKLFTPNFTTRNGGSGLGLAISKSVLDKCGATITYSRSFELGGAAFTIRYPAQS